MTAAILGDRGVMLHSKGLGLMFSPFLFEGGEKEKPRELVKNQRTREGK